MSIKFPILKSNSKFKLIWDIMMLSIIFYICFLFSLEISFDVDFDVIDAMKITYILRIFAFFLYFIDILLKMNTSFYRLICIAHFLACIWHAWPTIIFLGHNYRNFHWMSRYLVSLYWLF